MSLATDIFSSSITFTLRKWFCGFEKFKVFVAESKSSFEEMGDSPRRDSERLEAPQS